MKSKYLEKIIGKKCRQSLLIAARIQDHVMYKIANDNVKTNMGKAMIKMDKNSTKRKKTIRHNLKGEQKVYNNDNKE